ncbi:MAG: hypothetical protein DI535_19355 [Citrobacter freundii]|nr:MAG: hypothetical protein DI535_19355 [Citrobacter freundii]
MKEKGLFLLIIAALLVSCSHKIKPDRPSLTATDFKLDSLPYSEINIPLQINLLPVYALAEKQVDTLFTSPNYPNDWVQSACDTRYKYSFRRGPLKMKAAGTGLNLSFTGFYKIIGSSRGCIAGRGVSPWTAPCRCGFDEPERRVNVSFYNAMSLLPDYHIKLSIKRNEPVALDKCEVCFWGQDVTKQVMQGLKTELDTTKAVLERTYGNVDLRPQFQLLWDQLSKAYNIYEMGWLQINPQKIRINNLYAKDDSLYVNLGLAARPVVSLEKQSTQNSKIPNMGELGRQRGFSIFLDATLNYDSLSSLLNHQLKDKQFDFNKGVVKKKFIIKDVKLSGAGNEKLIIKIDFGGTDNGTLYLTGKPVYSPETHILEVKNIDFDIYSKDALLKTAEWLFSKRIINEVSKQTRFDLNTYIDSAKVQINQQLNREWLKGISSKGKIDDIQLIGIYPLRQALVIRSNCSGDLAVKVDSIDFSL